MDLLSPVSSKTSRRAGFVPVKSLRVQGLGAEGIGIHPAYVFVEIGDVLHLVIVLPSCGEQRIRTSCLKGTLPCLPNHYLTITKERRLLDKVPPIQRKDQHHQIKFNFNLHVI